ATDPARSPRRAPQMLPTVTHQAATDTPSANRPAAKTNGLAATTTRRSASMLGHRAIHAATATRSRRRCAALARKPWRGGDALPDRPDCFLTDRRSSAIGVLSTGNTRYLRTQQSHARD